MSESNKPFICLNRIVIQTTSPMAIHSGGRELGFDNQLVRDANNLPYIPASTIAGVWRHIVQSMYKEKTANKWFGTNQGETSSKKNKSAPHSLCQHASILQISNGLIHNSQDVPQNGLIPSKDLESDPLLSILIQNCPHKRERVSINDMGSAKEKDKFDQILLHKGVRFSIDIKWGNSQKINAKDYLEQWQKILDCWQQINFAFGSSTRNGLGQFKIISINKNMIELRNKEKAVKAIRAFNNINNVTQEPQVAEDKQNNQLFSIKLQATSTWRCGSSHHLLNSSKSEESPKILSYSEQSIKWDGNIGKLSNKARPVLCGSSIKGIIAHRITFHYNRFKTTPNWANGIESNCLDFWSIRPEEIDELFGNKSDGENDPGKAGQLIIPDCEIHYNKDEIIHHSHNSINRFTGGVMPGALFSEELLYQPTFTIKAYVARGELQNISIAVQKAIKATLDDLYTGRLSIGAGTGRGTSLTHGVEEYRLNTNLYVDNTDQEQSND